MKKCTKCKQELEENCFYSDKSKKDGLGSHCKECNNKKRKEYNDKHKEERALYMKNYSIRYNEINKKRIQERVKLYSINNKDKRAIAGKRYRNENKEKIAARKKAYYENNKSIIFEKQNKYRRERLKTNVIAKLTTVLRDRLHTAMRISDFKKQESTLELVGCSVKDLKIYLESLFQSGMSWNNYGYYGWHIDHIRPCASFDLTDPEQQKLCFHYTNLQPLWRIDNQKKGSKIIK